MQIFINQEISLFLYFNTEITMQTPALIKPAALSKAVKQKVNQLLKQDKITLTDIADLTDRERLYFTNTCTKILNSLSGSRREMFIAWILYMLRNIISTAQRTKNQEPRTKYKALTPYANQ